MNSEQHTALYKRELYFRPILTVKRKMVLKEHILTLSNILLYHNKQKKMELGETESSLIEQNEIKKHIFYLSVKYIVPYIVKDNTISLFNMRVIYLTFLEVALQHISNILSM